MGSDGMYCYKHYLMIQWAHDDYENFLKHLQIIYDRYSMSFGKHFIA